MTKLSAHDDLALWFKVQAFLTMEARLLDDQKLHDWVALFSDDARYWMPVVTNRTGRDIGKERGAYGELAHFDDTKTSLTNRVKRLDTGMAWAESPPSRTRHMVSNVEVMEVLDDGALRIRSNFLVYRSHLEYDVELFAGFRDDLLRPEGDSWRIAARTIILDQSVVTQKNLGGFFFEPDDAMTIDTLPARDPAAATLADLMRLDGRVALVTGAGAGLGRAIAICLAQQGARVAVLDRDEAAVKALAGLIVASGGSAEAHACDVTNELQVQQATAAVAERWSGIDMVVNSAGVTSAPGMPFTNNTEADWDRTLAINLKGAFFVCKAATPWLVRSSHARIVNIASITGVISAAYMPPYSVSKAALISLGKVLARDLAAQHVTVNSICPGFVWTPLWKGLGQAMAGHSGGRQGRDAPEVFAARVRDHVPMKRPQTAQEVAAMTAFLCSDAAANVTGQVIGVDGGVTI